MQESDLPLRIMIHIDLTLYGSNHRVLFLISVLEDMIVDDLNSWLLRIYKEEPFEREKDLYELENCRDTWVIFDKRPTFTNEEFEKLLTSNNTCIVEMEDETTQQQITAYALKLSGKTREFQQYCDINPMTRVGGHRAWSDHGERFDRWAQAMPELGTILGEACADNKVEVELVKKLIVLELNNLFRERRHNIYRDMEELITETIDMEESTSETVV